MYHQMLRFLTAILCCLIVTGCTFHPSSALQPSTPSLATGPSLQAQQPSGSPFEVFALDRHNDATAIATAPDSSIWFTDTRTSRIGRVSGGKVVTFATPTRFSRPFDIVAAPDGNMWFTESNGGKLGRITPDGTITEVHAHDFNHLYSICIGPDGALWFTGSGAESNLVGRMTMTGQQSEFSIPAAFDITAGPDGRLWISGDDSIYRMTVTGNVKLVKTIQDTQIGQLVFGADGNLWFWSVNRLVAARLLYSQETMIGRLSTAGVLKAFPLGRDYVVTDLAAAYGKIWAAYSHGDGSGLAEIDEQGKITDHFAPQCDVSHGVTLGGDGNIWFTCFKSIDAYTH